MVKDLRSFIRHLEKVAPTDIVRLKERVDPRYEITAYALEYERRKQFPVLIFDRVGNYELPVVTNVHATRERHALALETDRDHLVDEYTRRETSLIPPKRVSSGPVKERVFLGEKVDLTELPIPIHFQQDAGPYITAGVIAARDPDNPDRINASFHRMQVKDRDKLGVSLHSRRHLWDYQRRAEEKGKPLEIAVMIGVHPAIAFGGTWSGSLQTDHYQVIGGFLGEPLETVACETVDVDVPAHAEIVLEGEILPKIREPEGPFGEFTGYVSRRSTQHVIRLKAICRREDAIFQDVVPGFSAEHSTLLGVPHEAQIYRALKGTVPTVRAVSYPVSGTCRFHCYISLRKTAEGQPKNAIFQALAEDHSLKLVVVVDEDVDVYNESEVLWAVATRMQADEDVFIVPGVMASMLDPSNKEGLSAKMGVDATRPLTGWTAERCTIPERIMESVKTRIGGG